MVNLICLKDLVGHGAAYIQALEHRLRVGVDLKSTAFKVPSFMNLFNIVYGSVVGTRVDQNAFRFVLILPPYRLSRHSGEHLPPQAPPSPPACLRGPADGRRHHPYPVIGQAEDTRHDNTEGKGVLAWTVYGQLSVGSKVSYGNMGLDGRMMNGWVV